MILRSLEFIMTKANLIIYCDGGLANRLNSLLSGLAIVRYFNLNYVIHWPINQWCAAEYGDIFEDSVDISINSLTSFTGKLNNFIVLLHDEIASNTLQVDFSSAYIFHSIEAFREQIISQGKDIFYYPALIPAWIPTSLIQFEMSLLKFNNEIESEVEAFVKHRIGKPFYGLHLRRTDLNIGLTDLEVFLIAQQNLDKFFFVSSDNSEAERLACSHPNVISRRKSSYVEKKNSNRDWTALTADEDGRTYYGNIQRSRQSVIDGAIDMLILAHSQIIGYSGSTFQTMARNLGEYWKAGKWVKPSPIAFFPIREIERQIAQSIIPIQSLIHIANIWSVNSRSENTSKVINKSLDVFENEDLLQLLYAQAQISINDNCYRLASLYLREIIRISPNRSEPYQLLDNIMKKFNQNS